MANKTSKMPKQPEYLISRLEEEIKTYKQNIIILNEQIEQCELEIKRRKKLIKIQEERQEKAPVEMDDLADRLNIFGKNGKG